MGHGWWGSGLQGGWGFGGVGVKEVDVWIMLEVLVVGGWGGCEEWVWVLK